MKSTWQLHLIDILTDWQEKVGMSHIYKRWSIYGTTLKSAGIYQLICG
jgi:hypothetical protein